MLRRAGLRIVSSPIATRTKFGRASGERGELNNGTMEKDILNTKDIVKVL